MKRFCRLIFILLGLAPGLSRASTPVVRNFSTSSVYLGESPVVTVTVRDSGGDLASTTFSVSGPGVIGWQDIGSSSVTGAQATVQISWTPAPLLPGLYTARVIVSNHDPNQQAIALQTFDVFAGTETLVPFTIQNGSVQMFTFAGEIVTTTDTASHSTVVQSGGDVILWSGGRVKFEPGFHAQSGSFVWAAVDHDMNGYSDVEEQQQNFVSGVPDAWLVDQGINLMQPKSEWRYSDAQLQAAYAGGYKPSDVTNTAPQGFGVVLKTPGGYYGLDPNNGALTAVTNP